MLLAICVVGAWAIGRRTQKAEPRLTIHSRVQEGGERLVCFELQVPSGRRLYVDRTWLVTDWGTSTAVHGPPEWRNQTDPTGKSFAPGSTILLTILEPSQRLRRLQLETRQYETGLGLWRWRAQRLWKTRKLAAFQENPFIVAPLQSEMISTYAPAK